MEEALPWTNEARLLLDDDVVKILRSKGQPITDVAGSVVEVIGIVAIVLIVLELLNVTNFFNEF